MQILDLSELWLLVVALLAMIVALQICVRVGGATGFAMRIISSVALMTFAIRVSLRAVEAWYSCAAPPAIEWKGALWIAAVLVGSAAAVLIAMLVTLLPQEKQ